MTDRTETTVIPETLPAMAAEIIRLRTVVDMLSSHILGNLYEIGYSDAEAREMLEEIANG